jgi:hypothetical protein
MGECLIIGPHGDPSLFGIVDMRIKAAVNKGPVQVVYERTCLRLLAAEHVNPDGHDLGTPLAWGMKGIELRCSSPDGPVRAMMEQGPTTLRGAVLLRCFESR